MSIATEIQRLQLAKEDIKSAIIEKGGTVGDDALVDSYGDAIRGIESDARFYADHVEFRSDTLPPISVIEIPNCWDTSFMFYGTESIEEVTIKTNVPVKKINNMFYQVYYKKLRKINIEFDMSQVEEASRAFSYIQRTDGMTEINGALDFTSVVNTTSTFVGSTSLKELRFVPSCLKISVSFANSPYLSDESIQSIIDGLADLTGSDAQTITFHADVKAKLTEEQIATITSKNWTVA